MSDESSFRAFLIGAKMSKTICSSFVHGETSPAEVYWTAWVDPGVHTGLCIAVYAIPGVDSSESVDHLGVRLHKAMEKLSIAGWEGVVGAPAGGASGPLGAVLLNLHCELLLGEENHMVRTVVGRIRQTGAIWAGSPWDNFRWAGDRAASGMGKAGVGAEKFVVMRADRTEDYLSPVRINAALSYALEDEFGIELAYQQPSDAKKMFSSDRLRTIGLYREGPDHIRDAMSHTFLAIRKSMM